MRYLTILKKEGIIVNKLKFENKTWQNHFNNCYNKNNNNKVTNLYFSPFADAFGIVRFTNSRIIMNLS